MTYLNWPFFGAQHGLLAHEVHEWVTAMTPHIDHANTDLACRQWVKQLGQAGWTRYSVGGTKYGAIAEKIDTRAICLIRETLAEADGLADFAFALQGLGSGAITLEGTPQQKQEYLPAVVSGQKIAAFALTEPESGSDVAALSLDAQHVGDTFVLNGQKTWISNGGIADFYVVFARTGEAPGARGISAFIIDAQTLGLNDSQRLNTMAPHPLATLTFRNCHIPSTALLGQRGEGFKLAMRTLDIFRISVAAAALGFARRALAETLRHTTARQLFGSSLAQQPLAQGMLADMATLIDRSALLTYRAAWKRDQGENVTKEAAMAKLTATEDAQKVIDMAVQLHGAVGVQVGSVVERLYREIRALRIYEGASEVQRLIIGRELVKRQNSFY